VAILSYIKEQAIDLYHNRFDSVLGLILYIILFIQEKKYGTKKNNA